MRSIGYEQDFFSKILENIERVLVGRKSQTEVRVPDLWIGITLPSLSLSGKIAHVVLSLKSSVMRGIITFFRKEIDNLFTEVFLIFKWRF